jgi:hypothetical protein
MIMKRIFLMGFLMFSAVVRADEGDLEEVVVTGARTAEQHIPATSLKRQADFLLLKVVVSNDSREYKTRHSEIFATLKAMLAAAEKDKTIELSIIREDNVVLPLKLDDTTLDFSSGRGESLSTTINIKTRISQGLANDVALIAKLKNFVASIQTVGRTQLEDDEQVQVSVVNIGQYRDQVIQLFANDVKKITTALGGDYRVVVHGLDHPIQWIRSGTLDVTIFVPYGYDVVPTTVTSYLAVPERM